MKRKQTKPFIRYARLNFGEDINFTVKETLNELGFSVLSNPIEEGGIFISNVPLDEQWLYKHAKRFNIKLHGWKPSPDNEELEEVW